MTFPLQEENWQGVAFFPATSCKILDIRLLSGHNLDSN